MPICHSSPLLNSAISHWSQLLCSVCTMQALLFGSYRQIQPSLWIPLGCHWKFKLSCPQVREMGRRSLKWRSRCSAAARTARKDSACPSRGLSGSCTSPGRLSAQGKLIRSNSLQAAWWRRATSFSCKISCHGTLIDATKNHNVVFFAW